MLTKMDKRDLVNLVDISAKDFEPPRHDLSYEVLMSEIHGQTVDGQWVTGVEVFRRLYTAVGLGLLVWPTRLPGISHILNWGYGVFARNRVKWFGRCDSTCHIAAADSRHALPSQVGHGDAR